MLRVNFVIFWSIAIAIDFSGENYLDATAFVPGPDGFSVELVSTFNPLAPGPNSGPVTALVSDQTTAQIDIQPSTTSLSSIATVPTLPQSTISTISTSTTAVTTIIVSSAQLESTQLAAAPTLVPISAPTSTPIAVVEPLSSARSSPSTTPQPPAPTSGPGPVLASQPTTNSNSGDIVVVYETDWVTVTSCATTTSISSIAPALSTTGPTVSASTGSSTSVSVFQGWNSSFAPTDLAMPQPIPPSTSELNLQPTSSSDTSATPEATTEISTTTTSTTTATPVVATLVSTEYAGIGLITIGPSTYLLIPLPLQLQPACVASSPVWPFFNNPHSLPGPDPLPTSVPDIAKVPSAAATPTSIPLAHLPLQERFATVHQSNTTTSLVPAPFSPPNSSRLANDARLNHTPSLSSLAATLGLICAIAIF